MNNKFVVKGLNVWYEDEDLGMFPPEIQDVVVSMLNLAHDLGYMASEEEAKERAEPLMKRFGI